MRQRGRLLSRRCTPRDVSREMLPSVLRVRRLRVQGPVELLCHLSLLWGSGASRAPGAVEALGARWHSLNLRAASGCEDVIGP